MICKVEADPAVETEIRLSIATDLNCQFPTGQLWHLDRAQLTDVSNVSRSYDVTDINTPSPCTIYYGHVV